jgi:HEAT repeat protein
MLTSHDPVDDARSSESVGWVAHRSCVRSVVRVCLSIAPIAIVVAAGTLAVGCASNDDPTRARAEFSSKNRSLPSQSSGRQPGATPVVRRSSASGEHLEPASAAPSPTLAGVPAHRDQSGSGARPAIDPVLAQLIDEPSGTLSISGSTADDSGAILRRASVSSWAALRAHAIEASARNEGLLRELAPRGLVDENRGVRFVTCMAISESKLLTQGAADAPRAQAALRTQAANRAQGELDVDLCVLVRPLLSDESASVRAAAMLALTRCGVDVDLTAIAGMLQDADPEVRANAYLVLGELGNRSAVPLIRESLGQGMKLVNPIRARLVDLTAAEALVKLGDEREIEPIRAALFAPPEQSELTSVACDAIGRLRDEVSRPMLERLLGASGESKRLPEVRLSAARALVRIGAPAAAGLAVAREYLGSTDARVRAQTAALLGEIRSPESASLLESLVRDTNPTVQVAAAASLQSAE